MEQNYNLLAQSRASYYTSGSVIQFVKVELLKGEATGEIAVCLTFKNISPLTIEDVLVHFKCKSPAGSILCEDDYGYDDIAAAEGELFGGNDAIYISNDPIGSVEVELKSAKLQDGRVLDLSKFKRVRLPAPKLLPAQMAAQLCARTGKTGLTIVPQMLEDGWYCACGAFHPGEEQTVYCSECGSDRILLQNALTAILQEARPAAADAFATQAVEQAENGVDVTRVAESAEPTRPVEGMDYEEELDEAEKVLSYEEPARPARKSLENTTMYDARDYDGDYLDDEASDYTAEVPRAKRGRYAEEDMGDGEDEVAEKIIRLAPPITAILCALVVAIGVIIHFVG